MRRTGRRESIRTTQRTRRGPVARVGVALLLVLGACSTGDGDGGDGASSSGGPFAVAADVRAEIAPDSLAFGTVFVGDVESRAVEVRHVGSAGTLQLEVTLETASADLNLGAISAVTLAPGEEATVEVVYSPTDGLVDGATLRIATNAPGPSSGALVFQVPVTTVPQMATLIPSENPLDFEGVDTLTTVERPLVLRNLGSLALELTELHLAETIEFALVAHEPLPRVIAPGEETTVTLSYTPEGRDADEDALVATWTPTDTPDAETQLTEVALLGHEVTAECVPSPSLLDFGLRPPEMIHSLWVDLRNDGTGAMRISALDVIPAEGMEGLVALGETPPFPIEVLPAQSYSLEVQFTPTDGLPPSADPRALVRVTSNDPDQEGRTDIAVHGDRLGAGIEVYPPDILYFGWVGLGGTAWRDLVVYNAGPVAVTVDQLFIEGPFLLQDDGWGPTFQTPMPAALGPGESATVTLGYGHDGSLWETAWGKVNVLSDDPDHPLWTVLLNARPTEGAPCIIQLVPDTVEFGYVLPGGQVTRTVEVANIGPTSCGWHSADLYGCPSETACAPPADGADGEPAPSDAVHFAITAAPDAAPDNLPAGAALPMQVTFTAPDIEATSAPFSAQLRARVSSIDGPTGASVITQVPTLTSGADSPNLLATVARGELSVYPPEIDFGLVAIGCRSDTHVVTATNVGPAPLTLTGWQLVGCTAAVDMEDAPAADGETVLAPGESALWGLAFDPTEPLMEGCALEIGTTLSAEPTLVTLTAEGTWEAEKTDTFIDSEKQVVDVLFVVDDSGSMSQEQDNLALSFDAFIMTASEWESDYQIGVITTTVDFPDGGQLQGAPRYVSSLNWEKFIPNVTVGVTGSGTEQGLWAAKIALSPPLTDNGEAPCVTDGDCPFLDTCVAGGCVGHNHGFIREDAALEVVFVSDENDQSPETLEQYLNFFRSLKGYDHPDLLHLHAIVGPPGGCSSLNGSADPGHRYLSLAAATGGATYSICDADFAKGLEGIGEIAFAARMEYVLSQQPDPTTISVTINDIPCPVITGSQFNWTFDAETRTLALTEQGLCTASPGDVVAITYALLCVAESQNPSP